MDLDGQVGTSNKLFIYYMCRHVDEEGHTCGMYMSSKVWKDGIQIQYNRLIGTMYS